VSEPTLGPGEAPGRADQVLTVRKRGILAGTDGPTQRDQIAAAVVFRSGGLFAETLDRFCRKTLHSRGSNILLVSAATSSLRDGASNAPCFRFALHTPEARTCQYTLKGQRNGISSDSRGSVFLSVVAVAAEGAWQPDRKQGEGEPVVFATQVVTKRPRRMRWYPCVPLPASRNGNKFPVVAQPTANIALAIPVGTPDSHRADQRTRVDHSR